MPEPKLPERLNVELWGWLDSETKEYVDLVFRMLATLPGGDLLEDYGYEPFPGVGWKEADMLGEMLNAIESKRDVEAIIDYLLYDPEMEEEEDY
jgi:hypothetical protein